MIEAINRVAVTGLRIKGFSMLGIGILIFLAGPIIALITKQYLALGLSLIGIIAMLGGWYYLRRANWFERGGTGFVV